MQSNLELPRPGIKLVQAEEPTFEPCLELWDWVQSTFILDRAELYNSDHSHLSEAYIGFLWASVEMCKSGNRILGTAQLGQPSGTKWGAGCQEQQRRDWFGRVPDFLITLDAEHFLQCTDAQACALLEHELYHCAQATDKEGEPRLDKDGYLVWEMRGHDIEQFVGVIERYGAEATYSERVRQAYARGPKISAVAIGAVCGNCLRAA